MDVDQRQMWDPDDLEKVLVARRAKFEEQYKLLMASLEKPFPRLDLSELSALGKRSDANLKALQDLIRNLPPSDSASN